jgi:CubicO group peptidase (beta-lactamase class C family)
MIKKLSPVFLSIVLLTALAPLNVSLAQSTPSTDDISQVVEKFRQEIPQRMHQENIPGLAIAVVDDQGVLWSEGFGYTDWDQRNPVTPDTLFSIQSMSKSFTATAAMFAAQDGLVDLDAPITDYLPDFKVNSIFEEHPGAKITLRMLLSHTAGFAHEAPYGGNYDLPPYDFAKHIASISDTWLKFPIGKYYSYSNLGIDLAGYILQVKSGTSFIQYVQEKILQPLGMEDTTLDYLQVRADASRAIGHFDAPLPPPVDFLIIPSGGVWTTASDMARYLQFHINEGAIDGARLLNEDLAETMYTPPNLAAQFSGYALGLAVSKRNGARHFQHSGGGFGFNSSMAWYPDLKLGAVVLTNSLPQESYAYELSEAVLDDIIAESPASYLQMAKNSSPVAPAYPPLNIQVPLTASQLGSLIKSKALHADAPDQNPGKTYAGKYVLNNSGFPDLTIDIDDTNGQYSYTLQGNTASLTRVEPGLFFSSSGDAVDLRGSVPLFTNIHAIKINPARGLFRMVFYVICGLIFLLALFLWPVRAIIRKIRHKSSPEQDPGTTRRASWIVVAWLFVALASLGSLICLGLVLLLPNLVYFPWPHPYAELTAWQHLLLLLPYISLALAVTAALLAGLALKNRLLERFSRLYLTVTLLALFSFNIVLLL